MSGFFGIFRPQGGPIDLEAFEQMKTAMHRDGFDGMETHVEEHIAMGHLMLRVSPESKYDKQPLKSSCGNYLLVGHFRLDYRDELGDKLGLTQAELELTPDSQLAMLSYQKWKEKCVHHLEGDWAFVIFSNKVKELFFFKDKFGISAISYFHSFDSVFFSSDPSRFVFDFINKRNLNFQQLCRLSYVGVGVEEGKTLFSDIFMIKNSHTLKVDSNLIFYDTAYYKINDKTTLFYSNDDDYVSDLHSIYFRAILSRVRGYGKVGAFLSSGLDSTSVVHFASLSLKKRNLNISTFTSFPAYLDDIPTMLQPKLNEKPLVEKFQNYYTNIDSHFLSFPRNEIVDLFYSKLIDDPVDPIVTSNSFWIEGIFKAANDNEVKKMLTGQMGNFTISWHGPFNQFNLLVRLKFGKLIREIILFKQNNNCSYLYSVKEKLLSEHYRQFYVFWQNLSKSKIELSSFYKNFLTANKPRDLFRVISNLPSYRLFFNSRKMRSMLLLRSLKSSAYHQYRNSNNYCLEIVDPTADMRLIEFSFSIPESLYNKNGMNKYIYRKMMRFYLPSEILFQNLKIPQSGDIAFRLKHAKEKFDKIKKDLQSSVSRNIVKEIDYNFINEVDAARISQIYSQRRKSILLLRKISLSMFVNKNLA